MKHRQRQFPVFFLYPGVLVRRSEGKRNLEDLGVDGKIILK
jgi:hypothetical protein